MGRSTRTVWIFIEISFCCILQVLTWLASYGGFVGACSASESEALLQFRKAISGEYLTNWIPGSDCCGWQGVTCRSDESSVKSLTFDGGLGLNTSYEENFPILDHLCDLKTLVRLDLHNNNLPGNVPACLGNLTVLTFLDLSGNSLTGELPIFISRLSKLSFLDVSYNLLHGKLSEFFEIESSDGNLNALKYIAVSGNNFSGQVPTFENCDELEKVKLEGNSFEGPIPNSWSSLRNLQMLSVKRNQLKGPLPDLRNCTHLEILDVTSNELNGTIPSWLQRLSSTLKVLMLGSNRFEGRFPIWLASLENLLVIDLSNNKLDGTLTLHTNSKPFPGYQRSLNDLAVADVSAASTFRDGWYADYTIENYSYVHSFTCVTVFDISRNNLRGTIPLEIGNLEKLMYLNISSNMFSGSIPVNLGNDLSFLYSLDVSFNRLRGSIPQELTLNEFLHELNVSYNALSGPIPQGYHVKSFNELGYLGNPGLCASPLQPCHSTFTSNEDDSWHSAWSSAGGGFFIGFVVTYCASWSFIFLNSGVRSWVFRHKEYRQLQIEIQEALRKRPLYKISRFILSILSRI